MYSKATSIGLVGIDGHPVEVEALVSPGMPCFDVVGLPDAAVKESRERVRAAIKTCGCEYPTARITVNLAPADVRKEGAVFDIPILVSLLAATEQLPPLPADAVFAGELALDGHIRHINGVLSMALCAKALGYSTLYIPLENAAEASVVEGVTCYAPADVGELIGHLRGDRPLHPVEPTRFSDNDRAAATVDFAEVRGQEDARRALELAAAGGHNVLMIGPPGTGKSMLAKRFPTILPRMTFDESVETTKIYSIAGLLAPDTRLITERPFRAPHHNASPAALAGGGRIPGPGEVSLAHNGVLFLDELPEFGSAVLETLRQPLEDGTITLSRASGRLSFPCAFQLIAAMNPCRCGYYGHPSHQCSCSAQAVERYLSRISGPMLDRLDIHVEVPPVDFAKLSGRERCEDSASIRRRVAAARDIQLERFRGTDTVCNARITPAQRERFCSMTDEAERLLEAAFTRLAMSGRSYERILKLARTAADLEGEDTIGSVHISEALQYRTLDRKYWSGRS